MKMYIEDNSVSRIYRRIFVKRRSAIERSVFI